MDLLSKDIVTSLKNMQLIFNNLQPTCFLYQVLNPSTDSLIQAVNE